MKKLVIGVLLIGVILLVVAGYVLLSSLDTIVESVIEQSGSQITGTQVTVGSVEISLSTGEGVIREIRVSNPQGFPQGDAFSLEQIEIGIDTESLAQAPIVLDQVAIYGAVAQIQRNTEGEVNLDRILAHIKSSQPGGEEDPGEESAQDSPKLRIDEFVFQEGVVKMMDASSGKELEVPLPALQMRNVGGQEGATPDVIGREVLTRFSEEVAKVLARAGLEQIIDKKLDGGAAEAAKKLLEKVF